MPQPPSIIYLEDGWQNEIKAKAIDRLEAMLEEGFSAKTNKQKLFTNQEYAQIYTVCYNMCTQRSPWNWSEQLYLRHGDTIASYLRGTVLPKLKEQHGEFLLRELARRDSNHKIMNRWLKNFFMYLDRFFVKFYSLPSLEDAGCLHFKTIIFDALKHNVSVALMLLIDKERDGAVIDRSLINSTIRMYETMGLGSLEVYIGDLEFLLLQGTREYYRRKTSDWLENDASPAYMLKVEKAMHDEAMRVKHYLHSETGPKLHRVIEEEALSKRIHHLLEKEGSGFCALLANDMCEDLARMYRLLSTVKGGAKSMGDLLRQHVLSCCEEKISVRMTRLETGVDGKESAEKEFDDPQLIADLIDILTRTSRLVADISGNDPIFHTAVKDAFEDVVNRNSAGKVKIATLLGNFCDGILKTGSSDKRSDLEQEALLDHALRLFTYIHDKDMFAQTYRVQLSRRLLNQRSASDDMERVMIGKLKLKCGSQFTAKMEGMMNDLSIGIEHAAEFSTFFQENVLRQKVPRLDFTVQVLTNGHWPVVSAFEVKPPAAMLHCTQLFQTFYAMNNSKRRLQWHYGLGNAVVRAAFGSRFYDLQVTTLQAMVLLHFNLAEPAHPKPFSQLVSSLGMPEEHLKRALHSLSCGKVRVLKRLHLEASANDKLALNLDKAAIKLSDSFVINESFNSPLRKIRIPMASLAESQNPKVVEEERGYMIEASVVRVMKARKIIGHQELIAEVLGQLSFFRPDLKVVKRRIEVLIEREYLERDPEDTSKYRYLA